MHNISWLASYPKSGNTWIRMFLNAFITKMPLNINSSYQMARLDIDPGLLQLICPTPIKELNHSEQFVYRPAMLLNMLKLSPGRLVLKTHMAKIALDGLVAHPVPLSDCAIYIIRDPRDVCISLADHLGVSIDAAIEFMSNLKQGIEDSQGGFVNLLLTWSEHVKSWTMKNNNIVTMTIKYEDMLRSSISIFEEILQFLQLTNVADFEQRFEFALKETCFDQLSKYEQENPNGFVEKGEGVRFFRVGQSGQWKSILTDDQIDKIWEDHGEVMKEFDYEKDFIRS
jgi:hypothetical protein